MTPDSFFKINQDVKPGEVYRVDRDAKRLRPSSNSDRSGKDFKKILSRRQKEDNEEDPAKASLEDDKKSASLDKKPKPGALDPNYNQLETVAKDSKVAPKIGKEKPAPPSEEPWAMAALEDNKETAIDSPADLFGRLAKEKAGTLKSSQLAEEIKKQLPQVEDFEISKRDKKGFLLTSEKPLDQDLTSVNLFVLALGANDNLVYADKLEPPKAISQEILKLCEEITNNVNKDLSKTTIILKNAGAFNGVEVTVTSFKSAQGEINIQFSNLTQSTKDLLDLNLNALKQALDKKGYTVHMIATTTVRDEVIAAPEPEKKDQNPYDDNQDSRRQQKEKDNQDEQIV